ncbi:LysR family transcriptional regulator [Streptomyces sp. SDT5-1]|uniref:LysR family transcriptional regulator n=1 Tax=Streptomyces sp. SDT5-1 TaxID=3406418 RepID=UPI003FD5C0D0
MFVTLSDEMHFRRAASRLFMTQSALSQQIRALEQRVGLQLIDRTTRTVTLTPSGKALLPEARAVANAMDGLHRTVRVRTREVEGRVVIGTLTAEPAMPQTRAIIEGVRTHHPNVIVEMRSLNFANQYEALTNGEVDVAFLRPPAPAGIRVQPLAEEPRVVCLPSADPLVAKEIITLEDLSSRSMVTMPSKSPRAWRDFWAINPRPDSTPIHFGPLAVDVEEVLAQVALGNVIGFLPASARDFYPRPGICYRDVVDLPPCTMALTWFAQNHDHPEVKLIRDLARNVLRSGMSAEPPDTAPHS